MNKEYLKEKLKHLIAFRTNLMALIIVLGGGVSGLFFIPMNPAKFFSFLFIGIFYLLLIVSNLNNLNKEIKEALEGLKNDI